jgi:hypothetical protein
VAAAVGAEAEAIGRGGIAPVARLSGSSRTTVQGAVNELRAGVEPSDRVRAPGAGRPAIEDAQPGIEKALEALVAPETRGDPMSPLRWTTSPWRNCPKVGAAGDSGQHPHRVEAVEQGRLSAAGVVQDQGRRPAPGPRRPVRLHQHDCRRVPGCRGSGHQHRHQEEGVGRRVRQQRPRMAADGAAGGGQRP